MPKKILVIGAHSTAGSYFIYHCLKKANFCVYASSRRTDFPYSDFLLPYRYYKEDFTSQPHQLLLNINDKVDTLTQQISSISPDYIVNFSSLCMVGQSWLSPNDWYKTNILGQSNLMQAIGLAGGISHYLHFSTPEVYGSQSESIAETTCYNPSTPYAVSRAAGDMVTRLWAERVKIPTTIIRASSIYCECQHLYRIIPKCFLFAYRNIPLRLEGNGESVRHFIHMEDVCEGILTLLEKSPHDVDLYHMASSEGISILELIRMILELSDSSDKLSAIERVPRREGLDHIYNLNDHKMRSHGWKDHIRLREGLERVRKWILSLPSNTNLPLSYIHRA